MEILVMGDLGEKFKRYRESLMQAVTILGIPATITAVTDYSVIAKYGVMATPSLVVDGAIVSMGEKLTADEMVFLIKNKLI